jgi:uncharacterized damage-inducible protein DinB
MPPSILAAAVFVALVPARAETDAKAMFLKHWQIAKEFTLAVADAMPAEGYDFRPNPEQLTFGYLMVHIADQNADSCAIVTGTERLPKPAANDKPTAVKFLTDSFDACTRAVERMPPEQWTKEVYKFQGAPVAASEALWYAFTHMAHHRGQAEVYLRVKNIKPPAWRF